LRPAQGAQLLDSSSLTIDAVVERIVKWHRGEAA
jgi:cytidylate kinase